MSSRYIVGIDLGTTNTAVSYVDCDAADPKVRHFEVPQLIAPGDVAARRQLPSFVYMAGENDLSPEETALPWDPSRRFVVGELARDQGARVANRVIASAKSWLCHAGVDRHAGILPWGTEDGGIKLSPVACSAMLLRHIQEAWDHEMGEDSPLGEQEVIVTVPASFDEAARELTIAASETAGFEDIRLVEEPQAAFYAWINNHPAGERKKILQAGDTVLVFDIGGGTTDFTLIRVGDDGESLERTAVGDHLLLGGDNIDMTLAKQIEAGISEGNKKLSMKQWHELVHGCRFAKERLLSDSTLNEVTLTIAGSGSKLIGKSQSKTIKRSQVEAILNDGFFPEAQKDDVPKRAKSGLQEFGLPYAADAAITRHLASFLARHEVDQVDALLFNGGAMTPDDLRKRVLNQVASWQNGKLPKQLSSDVPDMAVAIGAAYYGLVRRGLGARIRGGTPRSFYVGVDSAKGSDAEAIALCLAPKGLDEGSTIELERNFELVCNRPVRFKLYSSSTQNATPGDMRSIGDGQADSSQDGSDLLELPPIVTVLRAPRKKTVTVRLQVTVTELGALEIWCKEQNGDGRWRLAFDMRAGGSVKQEELEVPGFVVDAKELIKNVFSGTSDTKPAQLIKALEKLSEQRRDEWSMTSTRAFFDSAMDVENERTRSPEHEARWLNLCGYCLRPGLGAPLDDWRIKQMWRVFNEGLHFEKQESCRLAWWILWRRIAGGLSAGQQEQLFDRLAQLFLPSANQKKKWHSIKPTKQEAAEMWRILANLERLSVKHKTRLGEELLRRLQGKKKNPDEALHFWALGRIGGRVPLSGPLDRVVPPNTVSNWLTTLLAIPWSQEEKVAFPVAQMGRRTGDRSRDIEDEIRSKLADKLATLPSGERMAKLVTDVVALEAREERVALGDTLPAGLRMAADS